MSSYFDFNTSNTIAVGVIPVGLDNCISSIGLTDRNDEKETFHITNDFCGTLKLDDMATLTDDNNVNESHTYSLQVVKRCNFNKGIKRLAEDNRPTIENKKNYDHQHSALVVVNECMSKWSGQPKLRYICRIPMPKGIELPATNRPYFNNNYKSVLNKGRPTINDISRIPMPKGVEVPATDLSHNELDYKSIMSKWQLGLPKINYIFRKPMPKRIIEINAKDLLDLNSTSEESETGEVNDNLNNLPIK
jgi:hypothetical protein